ncbi:MAG: nitrilase-related carbon-nitrogen hydrolase [Nocardioidaceae bacterium]
MPQLRLALAQVNPRVGDLSGNAALVVESVRAAAAQGAHLVVLPEMVLTGYPIEDLAVPRVVHRSLAYDDGASRGHIGRRRARRHGRDHRLSRSTD